MPPPVGGSNAPMDPRRLPRPYDGGRQWSLSSSSMSSRGTTALPYSSIPSDRRSSSMEDEDDDDIMGSTSFRRELDRRGEAKNDVEGEFGDGDGLVDESDEDDEFDGYDLRDVIRDKWGECFDVEFQKVDTYGFRSVYLVSVYCIFITCRRGGGGGYKETPAQYSKPK